MSYKKKKRKINQFYFQCKFVKWYRRDKDKGVCRSAKDNLNSSRNNLSNKVISSLLTQQHVRLQRLIWSKVINKETNE